MKGRAGVRAATEVARVAKELQLHDVARGVLRAGPTCSGRAERASGMGRRNGFRFRACLR